MVGCLFNGFGFHGIVFENGIFHAAYLRLIGGGGGRRHGRKIAIVRCRLVGVGRGMMGYGAWCGRADRQATAGRRRERHVMRVRLMKAVGTVMRLLIEHCVIGVRRETRQAECLRQRCGSMRHLVRIGRG